VGPAGDQRGGQPDCARQTLGDLLYGGDQATSPVSEKEWVALVGAIAAGDQRALHVLFERTHRIVFTLIMRVTNNRETAEELTLDVFHDVWRRASLYDPAGGPVIGWIMNQARSRAIDRVRFEGRKKRVAPSVETARPEAPPPDAHDLVALDEQGRRVRQALATLTPDEREAIETAFFSEMTYQEVAVRLNQPLGTVKTRVRSGLAKLRRALSETVDER
jgi:RNA polymerase sigma-70 factor, ECF subfamily